MVIKGITETQINKITIHAGRLDISNAPDEGYMETALEEALPA